MSIQDVFTENKHLSEDEVVLMLCRDGDGMSIKEAQTEYQKLAIEHGMIKSIAQKKAEWLEATADVDLSTEAGVNEAKAIGTDIDIGSATVVRYMRSAAEAGGFELALKVNTRTPTGKWAEVVASFNEEDALNSPKEDVVARIAEVGEFDDKKAASYYNRLRKEFGWVQPVSMSQLLKEWFIANSDASNEQIVEMGISLGMTDISAKYYVPIYNTALEIAQALSTPEEAEAA